MDVAESKPKADVCTLYEDIAALGKCGAHLPTYNRYMDREKGEIQQESEGKGVGDKFSVLYMEEKEYKPNKGANII